MALLRRRRTVLRGVRPKTLTASGQRTTAQTAEQQTRVNSAWQARSFYYYDALGEIKYAASFYARLSKLKLFAGEWQEEENGERTLVPTTNAEAIAALARLRDPGGSGGRAAMLGSYGRLQFIAGESILFYTRDGDGLEKWEMLSTRELRMNPTGAQGGRATYQRISAPELGPETFRDPGPDEWENVDVKEAIAYRLWRRHPQYSQWPDSPMRGVLEICEQLLMLDRAARSRSISRTAGNGILWLDSRISEPPPTPEPDEDVESDPFVADLTATMTEPMTDEGSASHVVPLVTRIDVPVAGLGESPLKVEDLVYHMKLTEPGEFYPEAEQIERVIHRLALDLEMPPEVLEGKSGGNHWSAWEVSEDAWEHLEPYAQAFCDDVTSAYYLPTLKESRKVPDWDRYAIGYDPASLRREPERSKDSKDLHDRGTLSDEALRTANGFTEDDAPSDDERRVWLSRFSKDPGFALGEDPARSGSSPDPEIDQDGNETTPGPVGDPSEVQPGAPDTNPADGDGQAVVLAQVLAALEVAVYRARELASNRVVTQAKRDPAAKMALQQQSGRHAPAILGRDATRRLCAGIPEGKLIDGFRGAVTMSLRRWGLTDEQTQLVLSATAQHALATLYDATQKPFPPPFYRYIAGVVVNGSNGSHP